jgi:hypothetical protein
VCGLTSDSDIPASARVYALEGNLGLLAALSALTPIEAAAPLRAA